MRHQKEKNEIEKRQSRSYSAKYILGGIILFVVIIVVLTITTKPQDSVTTMEASSQELIRKLPGGRYGTTNESNSKMPTPIPVENLSLPNTSAPILQNTGTEDKTNTFDMGNSGHGF